MKFKICVFVLCALINMSQQFSISKMCNLKNEDNINSSVNKLRRNILYSTILLNTLNIKKSNAYTSAYTKKYIPENDSILSYIEKEQQKLFKEAISSVCFITTEYTSMGEKFNLDKTDLPKGVGSGFIWDDEGHIITNFHVINKVDNANVVITDKNNVKKTYVAKLTGIDPDIDLAVLKIDIPKKDLHIIKYNKDIKPEIGQFSYAIGNPFGQDHTLTSGIISAVDRELTAPTGRKIYNVIQTDAAINPGNSGGPLLNSKGELIGINTASLGLGVSSGVGFTIPIKNSIKSITDIINTGYVQRAILGISYMERNPSASESEKSGIPIINKGILVLEVPENSPAQDAGLVGLKKTKENKIEQIGDIIIGIDKYEINNPDDLNKVLKKYNPNDIIKIKYLRNSKEYETTLKLGNYKGTTFTKLENERGEDFNNDGRKIDIPLQNLEPAIKPKL